MQDEDEGTFPMFEVLHNMINIPLLTGRPPKRWLAASSVCLEKETGNPQTDKIRIIHLYEADLNLVWKLLWGSRLVQQAEKLQQYPDAQYGSRPGRNSIDAVLCKILCYEFTRVSRSNMGLLDNDAMANYDRIICSLSSIACQRLGMPSVVEHLHNEILLHLRYNIKTGFGTSSDMYGAKPSNPTQGQGQGSGNAPSCWGAVSTPMWSALRALCAHSFKAHTADYSYNVDIQGEAFVDDATNLLNDIGKTPMDEATLVNALQTLAQMWERLLFSTGGALKPQKCFWYAITWQWASGFPIMRSTNKFQHSIAIHDSPTNTNVTLQHKGIAEAERTLGVRIAPNGSQHRELAWLRSKAHSFASYISKGNLSREEAHRAYHSIFIPSLTYSLGSTSFTAVEATSIQKRPINLILASMGINRNMPRSVVYAPITLGGLGFKCLYTEQGWCQQIENLVGHIRINSTVGKLIRSTLSLHQLTAGTSTPTLSDPDTPIPYLEKGWITSIRQFLSHIGGEIEIADQFTLRPVRANDHLLMDQFNDPTLLSNTLERINHCRLYLQVTNLADICNGAGNAILPAAYHGHLISDSTSTIQWPRQPCPPESSWKIWQRTLHTFFLVTDQHSLRLRPQATLGEWLPSLLTHHRQWHYTIDPPSGHAWHKPPTSTATKFHQSLSIPNPDGKYRASGTGTLISTATPDLSVCPARIPATVILASSTTLLLSASSSYQPPIFHPMPPAAPCNYPDFPNYLRSLPAWERRLLYTTTQHSDTLTSTLADFQVIIACDGSKRDLHSSFGWVIGSEMTTSWTGQGPADGAFHYQTSQRAELYGILAALRFSITSRDTTISPAVTKCF
jgi:hypothetical protein